MGVIKKKTFETNETAFPNSSTMADLPRRPRRKRSLLLRSCTLSVLWWSSSQANTSSPPLVQHRVRPAQRQIAYEPRQSFSPFWIPSVHERHHENTESNNLKQQPSRLSTADNNQNHLVSERQDGNKDSHHDPVPTRRRLLLLEHPASTHGRQYDVYAHIHADASLESPDGIFRDLRHTIQQLHHQQRTSFVQARTHSVRQQQPLTRRINQFQEDPGFVVDTTAHDNDLPVVVVSAQESEGGEFNVTAGTEYNVSVGVVDSNGNGQGENRTATNDTSTVVFTENEVTNTTQSQQQPPSNNNNNTSQYDNSNNRTTDELGGNDSADTGRRFRPIRIRAYLSEMEGGGRFLTDDEHLVLLQDIVRPALLSWSSALRVDPVVGNLTVDAHQLLDGSSCGPGRESGLPSALVPLLHSTDGVANTDLIVYLNLGFVNARDRSIVVVPPSTNETNSTLGVNGTNNNKQRGKSVQDRDQNNSSLSGYLDSSGDMLLNTTLNGTVPTNAPQNLTNVIPAPPCSGEYLAASTFCSTDQYDRPTAAILHICIGKDFFKTASVKSNIMTIRHELGVSSK